MRSIFTYLFFFIALPFYAQHYALDSSFGAGGVKFTGPTSFFPTKGLLATNNNYYMASYNKVVRVDYSGNIVTSFGTWGYLTPALADATFSIINIAQVGDHIFIYGTCNSTTTKDIFICKFDLNGNYDTSFGTNGQSIINMGGTDVMLSFVAEPSGKLYAAGRRTDANGTRIIYFKVNTDGSLDTAFDPVGYKMPLNQSSGSSFMTAYADGYLITGHTTVNSVHKLVLFKFDSNGNPDNGYAPGGLKLIDLTNYQGMSDDDSCQIFGNKLYLSGFFSPSISSTKIIIYDLANDTSVVTDTSYTSASFLVADEGIYFNGWYYCGAGNTYCGNKFNLRRKYLNGDTDPTFQENTVFQYNHPNAPETRSRLIIKDADGRFLIAGYRYYDPVPWDPATYAGFLMIRLNEEALATTAVDSEKTTVYPNPFDDEIHVSGTIRIRDVAVTDLSGRHLSQPSFESNGDGYTIRLTSLPQSGIYLLKLVQTDGSVIQQKIVRK